MFFFAVIFKEVGNLFSLFPSSSYRNTRESSGELEKAFETLAYWLEFPARVPTAFLILSNFHSCFYRNAEYQSSHAVAMLNHPLTGFKFPTTELQETGSELL